MLSPPHSAFWSGQMTQGRSLGGVDSMKQGGGKADREGPEPRLGKPFCHHSWHLGLVTYPREIIFKLFP